MKDSSCKTPPLKGMDRPGMVSLLQSMGEPAFRGRQLFEWVFAKGVDDFGAMTNLAKPLRQKLEQSLHWGGLDEVETVGEPDATQKMLFRCEDGEYVESVLMRGLEEEEETSRGSTLPANRLSLCVSSQVGCALGCVFCMTGKGGYRRNLAVDEILDQVLQARKKVQEGELLSNLVFMGMGEPLLNLEAVLPALRLLIDPNGLAFSTRRITVSTAGVLPGIVALGEAQTGVNLAVSLNATTQETRDRLMPGCKKWPLADLIEACRCFPLTQRRRITFEYVLFEGVNDEPEDLDRLERLLRGIPCKINLILYNQREDCGLKPCPEDKAEAFRLALVDRDFTVSLRRSKGAKLQAACGQLAGHYRNPEKGSSHEEA